MLASRRLLTSHSVARLGGSTSLERHPQRPEAGGYARHLRLAQRGPLTAPTKRWPRYTTRQMQREVSLA